jgi:hypothetical protein
VLGGEDVHQQAIQGLVLGRYRRRAANSPDPVTRHREVAAGEIVLAGAGSELVESVSIVLNLPTVGAEAVVLPPPFERVL